MAQLMPLPLTVSCFSKIQIGFAFLVPAHPGSPGKRAVKRLCVCVYYCYYYYVLSYAALLVVVDERERQRDVERRALERAGGALARLEGGHEVDPAGRTTSLERVDELGAEYRHQQSLELHVHACTKLSRVSRLEQELKDRRESLQLLHGQARARQRLQYSIVRPAKRWVCF